MKYAAILLAAGKGSRTKLDYNKVFFEFEDGTTVLEKGLKTFDADPDCTQIIVVSADYEIDQVRKDYSLSDKVEFTVGGAARQDSVWNGLQKVAEEYVLIHDAARPYLQSKDLKALKEKLETEDAALLMVPAVDTVKIVDEKGYVLKTPERRQVFHAQTPQGFKTEVIKKAHEAGKKAGFEATDDAQLAELFSDVPVACVVGDVSNKKITHPDDLKSVI
ncbi:MAG: 2-C-methyl-D-erythritol 4-phosphate cytidylyltransferase [Ileibacterium sp.]|nr:2-C-methyl-D-erythritol 4-phosphate cytidylyltransferase [Ileibacterium sp.]